MFLTVYSKCVSICDTCLAIGTAVGQRIRSHKAQVPRFMPAALQCHVSADNSRLADMVSHC
jgi:hypothetical protein